MPWTYVQRTGELFHGVEEWLGYSGREDGRNNPAMQGVKGIGPCPAGTYTMGNVHDSEKTGPLTICLEPDAATRAFIIALGRDADSFRVHGDSVDHNASEGCIIMNRPTRQAIIAAIGGDPPDDQLQVVADAPS